LDKSIAQPNRYRRNRLLLVVGLIVFTIVLAIYVYRRTLPSSLVRVQEPKDPFPYIVEDVAFSNSVQNVNLAGTLTIPRSNKKHPAVILISGYGPQNRDAEWFGHKPFLIIADHLTRQGIAVLRFDDRGFGKSSGNYHASTSQDFSTDVESAMKFLMRREDIDLNHIGLIGHSDGAMIAAMVAARSETVSFIVMLAGPGMLGGELMIKRQELWARKANKTELEVQTAKRHMKKLVDIIVNSTNEASLQNELKKFASDTKDEIPDNEIPPGMTKEEFISRQIGMLTSPWFKYFSLIIRNQI
jgi:alpha-beta hydrolase superfamily lysophospholipase